MSLLKKNLTSPETAGFQFLPKDSHIHLKVQQFRRYQMSLLKKTLTSPETAGFKFSPKDSHIHFGKKYT
jgi:hypothetical protein